MRKSKDSNGKEQESVTTLDAGPIADKEVPPVEVQNAKALEQPRSAVDGETEEVEGPKVRRFVVMKGGVAQVGKFRARLKEGKEIDTLNYNIRDLQRQGIRLKEITGMDTSAPIEGLL